MTKDTFIAAESSIYTNSVTGGETGAYVAVSVNGQQVAKWANILLPTVSYHYLGGRFPAFAVKSGDIIKIDIWKDSSAVTARANGSVTIYDVGTR